MLTVSAREAPGRAEKPVGIVRGQASRLPWAWTGLCFGVAFHQSGNDGARDIVNNVAPTVMSNVAWTRDSGGNTAANMSNTSYIQYPDNPVHDNPSTELTVHVRLKWAGTSDTWGGVVNNRYAQGVAPYDTWSLVQVNTAAGVIGGDVYVGGLSRSVANDTSGTAVSTTEFSSAFMRHRSGETLVLDIFGERGQTVASAFGDGPVTGTLGYAANQGIWINASDDPSGNFSGHYSQVMVWNRKLTTTEMIWLVQDPFGWYSPRRESIGVASPYPIFGGQSFMREVPSG